MSTFLPAVAVVLQHEGGYCDNCDDSGGPTNYGISWTFLSGDAEALALFTVALGRTPDIKDMELMAVDTAKAIYRACWWQRYGFAALVDQTAASKLFDMAVNMGAGQAVKLLQRALNALGAALDVDGQLGPQTLATVNATDPEALISRLVGVQSDFYRDLAERKPRLAQFLSGWLVRAAWPLGNQGAV
jgi:lysozyme family protein